MITYSIASSDYTFNMSVSTTTYESKEAFVAASKKLVYQKQPVNIGSMCQLIKEGHSFCHCYSSYLVEGEPALAEVFQRTTYRHGVIYRGRKRMPSSSLRSAPCSTMGVARYSPNFSLHLRKEERV